MIWTIRGHYPVKQGSSGTSQQKVHSKVRQSLCHRVSLWYLFWPWLELVKAIWGSQMSLQQWVLMMPQKMSRQIKQERRAQNHTFGSGYLPVGWGSSAWRGGGQKVRYVTRNPVKPNFLGSVFGRTDFSRIFIFEPPDFVADFVAGFFLLIFVGKSAQKNPPGKSPTKSSKFYTTKIPDNFLQRGQAKTSWRDIPGFCADFWCADVCTHVWCLDFCACFCADFPQISLRCLGTWKIGVPASRKNAKKICGKIRGIPI